MARTLIGRLQLVVQAMGLGQAKKVTDVIGDIERAAKRLSTAPWGQGFQRQIDKLALNARELDKVRRSWERLRADLASRNLSKALEKSEISAWKTATIGHFAQVRASMRDTEREAKRIGRGIRTAMRPAYVMLGGYTGVYMAGTLGREAFSASSERQREYFRQKMADIPENEREQIFNRSTELSAKYPSASITDIMEMARTARNTMGSTERGLEVLERMVQGFVTLQSAKGVEAAATEVLGLLRGLDNLGRNANGQVGVDTVNNLIEAFIRASQIEGLEFDVGSLWTFARRSKVAGPALSPEFLATVAPALMQDMGPDSAGAALAMAFKSFVIGDRSQAGKRYMEAQANMGLREGLVVKKGKIVDSGTFVGADLFARNPYQWMKTHLLPALTKAGVDITDDTAVAMALGKLSGNTNATGLLTRMVTQSEQIDRLVSLYTRAMGTEAAGSAKDEDPFVAWRGFQESLRNLSAAVGETVMPVIVPALNSLADTINAFAQLVKEGDPTVVGGAAALGTGAALYGGYKVGSAIYGLITAGASLQTAATMLQQAAVANGAPGSGGGKGRAGGTLLRSSPALLGGVAGIAAGSMALAQGGYFQTDAESERNALIQKHVNSYFDPEGARAVNERIAASRAGLLEREIDRSGVGQVPGGIRAALMGEAEVAGAEIQSALSVKAKPEVDTSAIDIAIGKARELFNLLTGASGAAHSANAAVDAEMRRNMTDYGVVP